MQHMQPWMLWALLWTVDSYAPSDSNASWSRFQCGVVASWPDIALDADKAKLLMDVEHARMLLWKGRVVQQATRCAAVGGDRSNFQGGRPQAEVSSQLWSECLVLFGLMLLMSAALHLCRLASDGALAFHYHLAHAKLSLMNCHPQLEECRSGDQISFWFRRWPSKAAADNICPGWAMLGNHHGQMPWSNLNHGVICLAKPTSQWWRSLRMPFQAAFAELSELGSFSDFSEATLSVVLFIVAGPIPPLRFAVTPQGPACGTRELVTRNQQAFRFRHAGRCVMLSWLRLSARRFKTRQHHGLARRRRCVYIIVYRAASLPGDPGPLSISGRLSLRCPLRWMCSPFSWICSQTWPNRGQLCTNAFSPWTAHALAKL